VNNIPTWEEQAKRVEAIVRSLRARIESHRDADIVIRVRKGSIEVYTDTIIVRYDSNQQ
jgi:hypothetical protein